MPNATLAPISGLVVARSGVTLMARLLGQGGALVTRASLSTIQYSVRDLTKGSTETALTSAGAVADLVFNDLQQGDARWELATGEDADNVGPDGRHGYNMAITLAATLFNNFDVESAAPFRVTQHEYQVSVVFTPATGTKFHVPFRFRPVAVWE